MAVTLNLEPLIFVREHAHGPCYAFPLAAPTCVSRGETEQEALEEQRHFLQKHLGGCPAGALADFVYPEDAQLLDLAVVLPRGDLTRRLRITAEVTVPCLVVPDGRAHWVHVLPLGHTVYVKPTETLTTRVVDEIRRAAAARSLTPAEYLAVLPRSSHRLVRLDVEVERDDAADATKRAATRRRKQSEQKDKAARKLLASVGNELLHETKSRRKVPPILGREREVKTLASLLSGKQRLSVMIVGEPLSGKTAVMHALLSQAQVRFTSHLVYATSGAQLVAGQSGFGQLEQRVDEVMAAAELLDAVLYFDDYGDLFAGHSGSIEDIAAMMRPWIADGRVRVVGELSPDVVEHHEKRHVAFFAAMHRITVDTTDAAQTAAIIRARIGHQKRTEPQRPQLDPACVEPLVELSERYLSYQAFPGKALQLAEELRAVHEGEIGPDGEPRAITVHDVYRSFCVRSGIPMFLVREEHAMRYTEVLEFFARAVIGQRSAIEAVAQTLCTVKAGLQPPAKPLANLLFVGPTGVGKTEVAKTLARFLFGGTDKLVRFDMSEYADPYAPERLIRGTEREEGELTRKVRQQPFCVVLLDEIEKAHPAVFDLLLQVLGEGRLSDARGKTTFFHNSIVIMTSNLGARHHKPPSGFAARDDRAAELQQHYIEQVDRHFRPEFVNRLDRVIPFTSLSATEIAAVARVALRGLQTRDGLAGRSVDLAVSDRAVAELASSGYSDRYGARALRRHVEDQLVAPIADVLARAGTDGDGAALRVVLAGHEQAADAGEIQGRAVVAEAESAALSVSLLRGGPRRDRRAGGELRRIATLRRTATACRELEAIAELRDRVQYLVAELARGGRRGRQAPGASVAEHARL
ncbi:MAG: AAA family ATPase, partial [Myxococcota bacterium]